MLAPYRRSGRLWKASLDLPAAVEEYLSRWGRPISYPYVQGTWPLSMYQTVYARVSGSAEMPSAGRPFTHRILSRLREKGVGIAPLVLHTGVASPERDEPPYEEYFDVPTYTTTMFGSTMAVMGVTPDVQPDLESVRTFSYDEKFFRKLFFLDDRLVGAIMIGPPKGRKKLIEIMRSRERITRPRDELLEPANLKD